MYMIKTSMLASPLYLNVVIKPPIMKPIADIPNHKETVN